MVGGDTLTSFLEHEDLLRFSSPSELKKLFEAVAAGKLPGLPVHNHSEPFI